MLCALVWPAGRWQAACLPPRLPPSGLPGPPPPHTCGPRLPCMTRHGTPTPSPHPHLHLLDPQVALGPHRLLVQHQALAAMMIMRGREEGGAKGCVYVGGGWGGRPGHRCGLAWWAAWNVSANLPHLSPPTPCAQPTSRNRHSTMYVTAHAACLPSPATQARRREGGLEWAHLLRKDVVGGQVELDLGGGWGGGGVGGWGTGFGDEELERLNQGWWWDDGKLEVTNHSKLAALGLHRLIPALAACLDWTHTPPNHHPHASLLPAMARAAPCPRRAPKPNHQHAAPPATTIQATTNHQRPSTSTAPNHLLLQVLAPLGHKLCRHGLCGQGLYLLASAQPLQPHGDRRSGG